MPGSGTGTLVSSSTTELPGPISTVHLAPATFLLLKQSLNSLGRHNACSPFLLYSYCIRTTTENTGTKNYIILSHLLIRDLMYTSRLMRSSFCSFEYDVKNNQSKKYRVKTLFMKFAIVFLYSSNLLSSKVQAISC